MSCGHPHEVDCSEVLERLVAYIDHELDGPASLDQVERIKQHLQECGPCLAEHDLENALKALVRRSCVCEPAPEQLRVRIRSRITMIRMEIER